MTRRPEKKAPPTPLVRAIDKMIAGIGSNRGEVSQRAGLDRSFLRQFAGRGPAASIRADNLKSLAKALQTTPEAILRAAEEEGGAPTVEQTAPAISPNAEIPILGLARGGALNATEWNGARIGSVEPPPALRKVPNAYALYVENESMSPRFEHGDLVFAHPHRPARPGETVVIYERSGGKVAAYLKVFVRREREWLICAQTHPKGEVKFLVENVVEMHPILSVREMFGA